MRTIIRSIFLLIMITGCVDPYNFVIKNDTPTLVIEGDISDVSYNDTKDYPSDGRYFQIKLSYTNDVDNLRDKVAGNASVRLVTQSGDSWNYTESDATPGTYLLKNDDFHAETGLEYQLQITLADGESYQSGWESMAPPAAPMGEICFDEIQKQMYTYVAGKKELNTIDGINVCVDVPPNNSGHPIYYRWKFTPTWIYIAPLAKVTQPDKKCWITNPYYLADYALQEDKAGGYKTGLFFLDTYQNPRIFEDMSVLITQFSMTEDYYRFWKELQEQSQKGGLFDAPPFNLLTNYEGVNTDKTVSGYFGVVHEQAKRWYFNKDDLSYFVLDWLRRECLVDRNPNWPPAKCLSCLESPLGVPTTQEPSWWRK